MAFLTYSLIGSGTDAPLGHLIGSGPMPPNGASVPEPMREYVRKAMRDALRGAPRSVVSCCDQLCCVHLETKRMPLVRVLCVCCVCAVRVLCVCCVYAVRVLCVCCVCAVCCVYAVSSHTLEIFTASA